MSYKSILALGCALFAIVLSTFLVFYLSRSEPQVSATNLVDKPGYFFAETAANYIYWALQPSNDAELDGFNPQYPAGSQNFGDLTELRDPYRFSYPEKQLKYFYNRPIDYSDPFGAYFLPGKESQANFKDLQPPTHLVLKIDPATGRVTLPSPSIQTDPAHVPTYGAIVWLVGSFIKTKSFIRHDNNLDGAPDQFMQNNSGVELLWRSEADGISTEIPVPDGADMYIHSGVDAYGLAAYVVAYFDSKPIRMLRVVLGRVNRP